MCSQSWSGTNSAQYPQQREFTLPGDPNAIPAVVEAVLAFLHEQWGREDEEPATGLVLQEALSNAVVHGCGKDPGKTVHCWVGCRPGGELLMVVRDPGPGFDVDALPDPLSPEGLAADHGRGIHLMRGLMDEVRFAGNGSEVRLRKF